MIMNGNTPRTLSSVGWIALLSLGLLLPLVPVQAQSPDPQDDHDRQIEALKKVIQSLEQQKRAEKEKHVAEERMIQQRRAAESDLQLQRAKEAEHRVLELRGALEKENLQRDQARAHEEREAVKAFYIQRGQAENLDRARKELETRDQERKSAVRFLQDSLLTQNRDPEKKQVEVRVRVDDKNPGVQKAMHAVEELTKMIEVKRQEIRSLEEKLRQLHADLEEFRAEGARGEVERKVIRVYPDAEFRREPIIIKIDPNVSPEQIKAQVEAIQGKIKQPIRVEIVNPEKGPVKIRNRAEPAPEARPSERRDSRDSNLEEKLEKIMKEVDELRREFHRSKQPGQ